MFICPYCKHTLENTNTRCAAFPDGIPQDVLVTRVNHRKPVEGDHGIQFESEGEMPDWINQVWPI
jgi:hypothetical protein